MHSDMSHRMTGVTCQQDAMTVTVDDLRSALGCETDTALAERLGLERSTIAQWRRRSGVPKRWHFVLKMKEVETHSLAARRRIFGEGDGYYVHMAALAVLDPSRFEWPELTYWGRAMMIQDWILKAAGYVIRVLNGRTCSSDIECELLIAELAKPEHRQGLQSWLFP